MKSAVKFLLRPFYAKYRALYDRITALETAVDYLLDEPEWSASRNLGFNGQNSRKAVFDEVRSRVAFDAILETGTWIGNSAGYLASVTGLPVHTCELHPLYQRIAQKRLKAFSSIHFYLADSRQFLRTMAADSRVKRPFIYLDAHWYADLPLAEEITLIARTWPEAVVLIDDFEVPGDPGYGYDDYGRNKRLTLDCFSALFSQAGFAAYSPTIPASAETGARTGYIILAQRAHSAALEGISTLKSVLK